MTALAKTAPTPPLLQAHGTEVLSGPQRHGSELRWTVKTAGGDTVVVAMLVPELSHDASVRRRWVADVQRVAAMDDVPGLLPTLDVGPAPDPADPTAAPPWRVRQHWPHAETFDRWLGRRAPVGLDEAATVLATIADTVHAIHRHGAVLRDLHPRRLLIDAQGGIAIADIGLTRVDVLSSRTAASLILEGSPYAAPEQFARNTVDQRADVYGLGVLLFRALTGTLPFGEEPAILRPPGPAPSARAIRPTISAALDTLVMRCLDDDPSRRPDSAATVGRVLRGDRAGVVALAEPVACQQCGEALRPGQRLCTHCGRLAVRFTHADPEQGPVYELVLTRVGEDSRALELLRELLTTVGMGVPPALNFLVGDQRMYSKAEQQRLLRLPLRLFASLDHETAVQLQARLEGAKGIKTKVRLAGGNRREKQRAMMLSLGGGGAVVTLAAAFISTGVAIAAAVATTVALGIAWSVMRFRKPKRALPLMMLRPAAAALPASDPLVARLAALLGTQTPADIRDQLGALALAVQHLVDHRAANLGEAAEIDAVTEPVERLVALIEAQVQRVQTIDAELAKLDEGNLVRRLAAAAARGDDGRDEHTTLLGALDRLRTLEDARAAALHRLLEAATLMRRAVDLGLSVQDDGAAHEREVARALATLSGPSHV